MNPSIFRRSAGFAAAVTVALLLFAPGASAAPPANDNFVNAQVIGPALPVSVPASNVDATAEPAEPAIGGNDVASTIWFRWTAPASQTVVIDLCGAGFTGSEFPLEMFAVRTSFGGAAIVEQVGECSVRLNATVGVVYYVQVEYRNDEGNFTFRLRPLAPPSNDNFAGRTAIGPALPASAFATTVDSTWEAGEPAGMGGTSSSRSIWFSWTAPSTAPVRLDFCQYTLVSGSGNRFVGVYTGNTLGTLAMTVPTTTNCELDFPATAGVDYKIGFSGNISGEMNLLVTLKAAPPPPNDNFANAVTVGPGLPVSAAGNTTFATAEAGEPNHSGVGGSARSVWYQWTPSQTARVRVKACAKDYQGARLGVYTGAAVNALTEVAEKPPFAPHCGVVLNAVAGTTYRIAAAGSAQDKAYGPVTLDIHTERKPGNDDFANAQVIGPDLPAAMSGTTVDATIEENEPATDPYGGYRNPSVWYRWKAPSDEATIFQACSTGEPVVLAVFSGTGLGELEYIDNAEKGCRSGGEGGRLAIAPDAGETYWIVVESVERNFDTAFTLSAIGPKAKPPVTKPPGSTFNLKKAIKKCKKIKSKKKRTACIRKARKKAAIIKCKKLKNSGKRNKCIKKARKKFG